VLACAHSTSGRSRGTPGHHVVRQCLCSEPPHVCLDRAAGPAGGVSPGQGVKGWSSARPCTSLPVTIREAWESRGRCWMPQAASPRLHRERPRPCSAHLRAAAQGIEEIKEHEAGERHGGGAWSAGSVFRNLRQVCKPVAIREDHGTPCPAKQPT
jgi:hypothetical protein